METIVCHKQILCGLHVLRGPNNGYLGPIYRGDTDSSHLHLIISFQICA